MQQQQHETIISTSTSAGEKDGGGHPQEQRMRMVEHDEQEQERDSNTPARGAVSTSTASISTAGACGRMRSQSVASTQPSVETVVVKAKRAASTLWTLLHARVCVVVEGWMDGLVLLPWGGGGGGGGGVSSQKKRKLGSSPTHSLSLSLAMHSCVDGSLIFLLACLFVFVGFQISLCLSLFGYYLHTLLFSFF